MLIIFYPGGGFGSTIEYAVRHFSDNFKYVQAEIEDKGSMHTFIKEFHPALISDFLTLNQKIKIASPRYPDQSGKSAAQTIEELKTIISADQKVIFITLDTPTMIERNWLFLYHKTGNFLERFIGTPNTLKYWNADYHSIDDMRVWEKRELFSMVIKDSQEFSQARTLALDSWLTISADDILYDFKNTVVKIFEYLEVTFVARDIDQFYLEWFNKQEYILSEYDQIESIIASLDGNVISWHPLSLMAESIIQYKLKNIGRELKCYGLDEFPTTTETLRNYLGQLNI